MPVHRFAAAAHVAGRLLLVLVTLSLWSIPAAEAARSCAIQEHPIPGGADHWSERIGTRAETKIVHLVQDPGRNPFDRQRPGLSSGMGGVRSWEARIRRRGRQRRTRASNSRGPRLAGKSLGELTVEAVPREVKLDIGLFDGNPKFTGGLRLGRALQRGAAQELVSQVRTEQRRGCGRGERAPPPPAGRRPGARDVRGPSRTRGDLERQPAGRHAQAARDGRGRRARVLRVRRLHAPRRLRTGTGRTRESPSGSGRPAEWGDPTRGDA